jgi:hypothetical protein
MALFGSSDSQSGHDQSGRYSSIDIEDESKPLRTMREHHHSPVEELDRHTHEDSIATTREIFALSRSLRRTNLFLKIVIGLLLVMIFALVSMNAPDKLQKLIKTASCGADRLLKTPVPPLSLKKVVFEEHPLYSQRPNEESDKAWDDLLPVSLLPNEYDSIC